MRPLSGCHGLCLCGWQRPGIVTGPLRHGLVCPLSYLGPGPPSFQPCPTASMTIAYHRPTPHEKSSTQTSRMAPALPSAPLPIHTGTVSPLQTSILAITQWHQAAVAMAEQWCIAVKFLEGYSKYDMW